MNARSNLVGRTRLGYVLVESQRLDEWQRFAADGLGTHVDRHSPDIYIDTFVTPPILRWVHRCKRPENHHTWRQ